MDSLLRLADRKYVDSAPERSSNPGAWTKGGPHPRVSSPTPGASTLMIRAPRSPNIIVACGPASARDRTITKVPDSEPDEVVESDMT